MLRDHFLHSAGLERQQLAKALNLVIGHKLKFADAAVAHDHQPIVGGREAENAMTLMNLAQQIAFELYPLLRRDCLDQLLVLHQWAAELDISRQGNKLTLIFLPEEWRPHGLIYWLERFGDELVQLLANKFTGQNIWVVQQLELLVADVTKAVSIVCEGLDLDNVFACVLIEKRDQQAIGLGALARREDEVGQLAAGLLCRIQLPAAEDAEILKLVQLARLTVFERVLAYKPNLAERLSILQHERNSRNQLFLLADLAGETGDFTVGDENIGR